MRSVREYKNHILSELGVTDHSKIKSMVFKEFWVKLNDLGWSRKTKSFVGVSDIDSTALITDEEWVALDLELHSIHKIL